MTRLNEATVCFLSVDDAQQTTPGRGRVAAHEVPRQQAHLGEDVRGALVAASPGTKGAQASFRANEAGEDAHLPARPVLARVGEQSMTRDQAQVWRNRSGVQG